MDETIDYISNLCVFVCVCVHHLTLIQYNQVNLYVNLDFIFTLHVHLFTFIIHYQLVCFQNEKNKIHKKKSLLIIVKHFIRHIYVACEWIDQYIYFLTSRFCPCFFPIIIIIIHILIG